MSGPDTSWIRVCSLEELEERGVAAVSAGGRRVAVFAHDEGVFPVDNRCPHMGFPLERGTVRDGILTCHWHQARFDLESGCTFDLWADDAQTCPVELRDGEVTPACVQTCPTRALTFGNLSDAHSEVSKNAARGHGGESKRVRQYEVLAELKQLPAVTYLRKVTFEPIEEA